MMVKVSGNDIQKSAYTDQSVGGHTLTCKLHLIKSLEQAEVRFSQIDEFLSNVFQFTFIMSSARHKFILLKWRQSGHVISGKSKGTVGHDAFRVNDVTQHFLYRPFAFSVGMRAEVLRNRRYKLWERVDLCL